MNEQNSIYAELLERPEWEDKRQTILCRDNNKCSKCQNVSYLNVEEVLFRRISIITTSKGKFMKFQKYRSIEDKVDNKNIENVEKCNGLLFGFIASNDLLIGVCELPDFNSIKNKCDKVFLDNILTCEDDEMSKIIKAHIISNAQSVNWPMIRNLHIHHKRYIFGNYPWEYESSDLITLCYQCHKHTHDSEKIQLYYNNNESIILDTCPRCNGTGYLPQFWYVQDGVCFQCWGSGFKQKLL